MRNLHCGYELNLGRIPFESALSRVFDALRNEGLGVLSRTDIRQRFREQLGVNFLPYIILEVWNAEAAYAGMMKDAKVGLLLPCHIVVRDTPDGVMVGIVNARALLSLLGERNLDPLMNETHARLCGMLAEVR